MDILSIESAHTSGFYNKQPLAFIKGKGALLWDSKGDQYIDCSAGHGVANIGHSHPKIVEAIHRQSENLITLPETFYNDQRAQLLNRLSTLVDSLDRVFFCNSGTEAIEAALKLARLFTSRTEIIAMMRGFHGRTFGSLSTTWNKNYRQPFEPLVPGVKHVPYNNYEELREELNSNTAAVLLETVQGEGGVHLIDRDYFLAVRQACTENGTLLILDEIQTGFGRTGKLFAFQHFGISPDILCLAKSIAGGLPMGAVLFNSKVKNISPGLHGSTFGGNPLACSAANAVLDILETEGIPQQAAEKGEFFISEIRKINSPLIREVRGLGLMIGIELKQKVQPYLNRLIQKKVLALPAGLTVIRLLPPLVITYDQIKAVVEILDEVLSEDLK
jgi:acetylornithine/LysW-gamma-L-lysine aminotransferase